MSKLNKFETMQIDETKTRFPMLLKLPKSKEAEFNQFVALHKMDIGKVPAELQAETAYFAAIREVCGDDIFALIAEQGESVDVEFIGGFYGAIIERKTP